MKPSDRTPGKAVLTDMVAYYAKRARILEQVYDIPERQADLAVLKDRVRESLRGHRVLELACGSGYWTACIAESVESVLATDINPECLELTQAKGLPTDKVRFA